MTGWTPAQLAQADQIAAWAHQSIDDLLHAIAAAERDDPGLSRAQRVGSMAASLEQSHLDRASLCGALAESLLRLHETGAADVALRAAVNGRAGAPGRAPVRAQRNHPGPAVAGPGPCPNNQEEQR